MKKRICVLATLLLIVMTVPLFAAGQVESAEESSMPQFIEIGTAGIGGAYYPIGIALAEILTDELGTQATAQITGGDVDNIGLVQNRDVKIAIATSASAYNATRGVEPYTEKYDNIMGLFSNLTQGIYQIAVLDNSNIHSIEDLKGKRVSLGPAGNLGVLLTSYVLEAAGLSMDDLRASYVAHSEGVAMMTDGNLDAVIIQSAAPSPALREIEAGGHKVRLISVPEYIIEKISSARPYLARFVLPASVHNTQDDVVTLNSTNMCIVDRNLHADVVYEITKALMENISRIQSSHPAASQFSLEMAPLMPIELHPGAARYFREQGLIK